VRQLLKRSLKRPCYMSWITFALLSALFAALTAILAKKGVAGIDSNLATAIRTSVVFILTWVIAFVTTDTHSLILISKRTWLFLILSGFATALSWLCYFKALQLGPVSKVASIDKLSLVFIFILGAIGLQESVTLKTIIGVLLVTAGTVVLALK